MMRRLVFVISVLATPLFAEGPKFQHDDPATQQEFESVYQDLRTTLGTTGNSRCIDSPTLCVDTVNNRVGINTATPATLLHLSSGTIRFDGTSPTVTIPDGSMTTSSVTVGARLTMPNGSSIVNTGVVVSSAAADSTPQLQLFNTGVNRSALAFYGSNTAYQCYVGMGGVYLSNGDQNLAIAGAVSGRSVNIYSDGSTTAAITVATGTIGVGIKGTSNGSAARAGDYGEEISSTTANGTPIPVAVGTIFDAVQITLTAGAWNLSGSVIYFRNGATFTQVTPFICVGGTTSGNSTAGCSFAKNRLQEDYGAGVATSFGSVTLSIPPFRLNPTTTTTYYLKALCDNWTAGTPTYLGSMTAVRAR